MFPFIVLDKIYWYRWYNLIKSLNSEYHKRFNCVYYDFDDSFMYLYTSINRSYGAKLFNYRRVYSYKDSYDSIYNINNNSSYARLPKNYFYSNGETEIILFTVPNPSSDLDSFSYFKINLSTIL